MVCDNIPSFLNKGVDSVSSTDYKDIVFSLIVLFYYVWINNFQNTPYLEVFTSGILSLFSHKKN